MGTDRTPVTVGAIVRAEGAAPPAPSRLSWRWLGCGLAVLGGALVIGCSLGPAGLPLWGAATELLSGLPGIDIAPGLDERQSAILWQIRLPRVVLGALVGAMLASAGASYQGVFRNPLADPYLLGVAAGAGLGATLAIAYGPGNWAAPVGALPLFAFVGAVAGVGLAWSIGRSSDGGGGGTATLILAGVAVASFLTAIQTFVQQQEAESLRDVYGWILGRLSTSGWTEVLMVLPYVILASAAILSHRRVLDVMSLGDDEAGSLGIRATRSRTIIVVAATLGTAAAVAVSGLIGFVGIIVPHTVRLIAGTSYRIVLPLSLLFGAAFLVLADVVARTVASPAEIPIGVVTAFFGAPFFAVVLRTNRSVTT